MVYSGTDPLTIEYPPLEEKARPNVLDPIMVVKRRHPGYIEYEYAKNRGSWPIEIPALFGEWQYWYKSPKGEIDAVFLPNHLRDGVDFWEIYSNGTLFEDVERFTTLEEAEKRIEELLL